MLLAGCPERRIEAYPDELAGVGVVVERTGDGFVVGRLIDRGPAAEAGVRIGDRIAAVDGRATRDQTLANVIASLRGRDGSEVQVAVQNEAGLSLVTLRRRVLSRTGGARDYRTR